MARSGRAHRPLEAQPGGAPPPRHADARLRRHHRLSGPRTPRCRASAADRVHAASRRFLAALRDPGGGRGQGFRPARPARHRQEPDHRQHHRACPGPRADGPVRLAEGGGPRRGTPAPRRGRARGLLPGGPCGPGAEGPCPRAAPRGLGGARARDGALARGRGRSRTPPGRAQRRGRAPARPPRQRPQRAGRPRPPHRGARRRSAAPRPVLARSRRAHPRDPGRASRPRGGARRPSAPGRRSGKPSPARDRPGGLVAALARRDGAGAGGPRWHVAGLRGVRGSARRRPRPPRCERDLGRHPRPPRPGERSRPPGGGRRPALPRSRCWLAAASRGGAPPARGRPGAGRRAPARALRRGPVRHRPFGHPRRLARGPGRQPAGARGPAPAPAPDAGGGRPGAPAGGSRAGSRDPLGDPAPARRRPGPGRNPGCGLRRVRPALEPTGRPGGGLRRPPGLGGADGPGACSARRGWGGGGGPAPVLPRPAGPRRGRGGRGRRRGPRRPVSAAPAGPAGDRDPGAPGRPPAPGPAPRHRSRLGRRHPKRGRALGFRPAQGAGLAALAAGGAGRAGGRARPPRGGGRGRGAGAGCDPRGLRARLCGLVDRPRGHARPRPARLPGA